MPALCAVAGRHRRDMPPAARPGGQPGPLPDRNSNPLTGAPAAADEDVRLRLAGRLAADLDHCGLARPGGWSSTATSPTTTSSPMASAPARRRDRLQRDPPRDAAGRPRLRVVAQRPPPPGRRLPGPGQAWAVHPRLRQHRPPPRGRGRRAARLPVRPRPADDRQAGPGGPCRKVFQDTKLPDGKYVIPGVLDSTTNVVEHPEVVADRLIRYAEVVGRDNVMAGTDCGFGTVAGMDVVVPSVTWAKFRSQAEGAKIASAHLWGSASLSARCGVARAASPRSPFRSNGAPWRRGGPRRMRTGSAVSAAYAADWRTMAPLPECKDPLIQARQPARPARGWLGLSLDRAILAAWLRPPGCVLARSVPR